jgi:flagellar export protein FliJ
VARVRHLLEQLTERIRQAQLGEAQQLGDGTTSAELRFALDGEVALRQQRHDVERELARWQNLRDQQQRIFQQARRERETFESLRDHQLREYERHAARRQQRQVDDLFLLRQAYLKRG